MTASC